MSPPTDGRSPETLNSAGSGYSIGARFLSYLSATWCGAVFLMLGTLWTGSISLIQTYCLHFLSTHRVLVLASALAAVCIGGILNFALGVAFGRFLLRAMPPHLLDRTRRRQFVIIAVAVFATLIGVYVSLCSFWMPPFVAVMSKLLPSQFDDIVHRLGQDAAAMTDLWPWQYGSIGQTSALILAGAAESVLFAVLWATGALGPLILRYPRPRAFLETSFRAVPAALLDVRRSNGRSPNTEASDRWCARSVSDAYAQQTQGLGPVPSGICWFEASASAAQCANGPSRTRRRLAESGQRVDRPRADHPSRHFGRKCRTRNGG
jgi:hypothetical protein